MDVEHEAGAEDEEKEGISMELGGGDIKYSLSQEYFEPEDVKYSPPASIIEITLEEEKYPADSDSHASDSRIQDSPSFTALQLCRKIPIIQGSASMTKKDDTPLDVRHLEQHLQDCWQEVHGNQKRRKREKRKERNAENQVSSKVWTFLSDKMVKCKECDAKVKIPNLKKHFNKCHKKESDKDGLCDICNLPISINSIVDGHDFLEHGRRAFC